jgi:hypothetical protein
MFLIGCGTPSALKIYQLSPVKTAEVTTAEDLFAKSDSAARAKGPQNAKDIVIVNKDNIRVALSLYELKDIIWLEVYVYNDGSEPFVINASDLVLMDGNRLGLRRIIPHEAANIYLAKMTGIPPYQPKYVYEVQSSTTGYIYSSGRYTAQTRSTITKKENPYSGFGYAIGAAITASRNKKFRNLASTLYSVGFVENSSIPGKTGGYGGVFWLKPKYWTPPLILRFATSGYEVSFKLKLYRKPIKRSPE